LRKEYVHPGVPQTRLFAPVTEAETAITTLRDAIKDMCNRTGNPVEARPDDDEDDEMIDEIVVTMRGSSIREIS
jgi:hypothetical protein